MPRSTQTSRNLFGRLRPRRHLRRAQGAQGADGGESTTARAGKTVFSGIRRRRVTLVDQGGTASGEDAPVRGRPHSAAWAPNGSSRRAGGWRPHRRRPSRHAVEGKQCVSCALRSGHGSRTARRRCVSCGGAGVLRAPASGSRFPTSAVTRAARRAEVSAETIPAVVRRLGRCDLTRPRPPPPRIPSTPWRRNPLVVTTGGAKPAAAGPSPATGGAGIGVPPGDSSVIELSH